MALMMTVNGWEFEVTMGAATTAQLVPKARTKMTVTARCEGEPATAVGTLFLNRAGDCVLARSAFGGREFRPGGVRDLIEEFCRATEVRECWKCGHRASAEHGDSFEGWATVTVDNDPGDAEVGPQPDVIDVDVCPECAGHEDPAGPGLCLCGAPARPGRETCGDCVCS
jgi:hypothetical protein